MIKQYLSHFLQISQIVGRKPALGYIIVREVSILLRLCIELINEFHIYSAAALSQHYRLAIRRAINEVERSVNRASGSLCEELLSANIIWSLFDAVTIRPSGE